MKVLVAYQHPTPLNARTIRMNATNFSEGLAKISFSLLLLLFTTASHAQELPSGKALERIILQKDSVFWSAYNNCKLDLMMSFVAKEVEFYHDKGGLLKTRAGLRGAMANGLCRSGNNEIERRPVAGTIKVFPIASVGAILRGQHTFHGIANPGDDGIAYFFHLWEFKDGVWQMTRVFSYDHAPLPANAEVATVTLTPEQLDKFRGTYVAPQTGKVAISVQGSGLALKTDDGTMDLLPKSDTRFFNRALPLEFEFVTNAAGKVVKFEVYENGKKVEEALRQE